ncbi:MAG: hypothetical protein CMG13_02550 [Candidatus Marinimicrobia bacterium]|nr:hypothetical protein [Candidatus Neomarinimicrobiota bacterium]|tara:strand:- start:10486 stop:10875 length:390 start_codon:yes stop_codon:yes gene_type:complete
MKYSITIIVLAISFSVLNAGCGGCQIKNNPEPNSKTSAAIASIPSNGKIEGFVFASCNKCNLGKKQDKKCSLGIKIDNKIYGLKNYKHDHNEAHNYDGICNSTRVGYIKGRVVNSEINADYFELIKAPK